MTSATDTALREAEAAFTAAHPEYAGNGLGRRPAPPGLRSPRLPGPRLPRLHGERPLRGVAGAAPLGAAPRARLRQPPFRRARPPARARRSSSAAGDESSSSSAPTRSEYALIFTANASHALEARRRVVSVRSRRPAPPHLRQPQFRERHPGVRPRSRRAHPLPADGPARAARGRGSARALPRRGGPRAATTSSPTRRNRTSPGSSTRWSGSRRRRRRGGTSCSTPRPSFPPTASTSADGTPTS